MIFGKDKGLGSLQRRLRNCLFGLRAELYAFGSSELVALPNATSAWDDDRDTGVRP
jgi:hypothetical protein